MKFKCFADICDGLYMQNNSYWKDSRNVYNLILMIIYLVKLVFVVVLYNYYTVILLFILIVNSQTVTIKFSICAFERKNRQTKFINNQFLTSHNSSIHCTLVHFESIIKQ